MIQIVSKKHWVTHDVQGTDMSSTNKDTGTYNSKKRCCMNGQKIWKSLFGEKYLLGKPVHFSVNNTANNADTWGLIQQFFQHLYRTANSIVHLMVWVKTAQILWYRQQYISLRRIQLSRIVLLTARGFKVETAQIHRYRQLHISPGEVQHSSKILWGIYSLFAIFP